MNESIHTNIGIMTVYVTFERQKLRGQFSKNLALRIYEFLFNSGSKISKEKRIMKVKLWKLKYDRNFQLVNCLFSLIPFFSSY